MDSEQQAHDIIEEFGTADDSPEELRELLEQNDISEHIIEKVIADLRG